MIDGLNSETRGVRFMYVHTQKDPATVGDANKKGRAMRVPNNTVLAGLVEDNFPSMRLLPCVGF